MNNNIKFLIAIASFFIFTLSGCKKDEYSFVAIKTPSNLTLKVTVAGADSANPSGNGSGTVSVTATSNDALTYSIDFGDSSTNAKQLSSTGVVTYKYTSPGSYNYTITANAIGTGGAISTISKKIAIQVVFQIPAAILQSITGGTNKVWITDKNADGHVGVGPTDVFTPTYYSATPNSRAACLYDDEITFAKDAIGNVNMTVDNKGQTFVIAAANNFYGVSGGDGCYTIDPGGAKKLNFMAATSASTTDNSTRIQFYVPGNGVINFATGANNYEILTITDSTMQLRNIGADGLAWYQKLKVK